MCYRRLTSAAAQALVWACAKILNVLPPECRCLLASIVSHAKPARTRMSEEGGQRRKPRGPPATVVAPTWSQGHVCAFSHMGSFGCGNGCVKSEEETNTGEDAK